jgi:uncharacterized protein YndB with AHSA1/START domain
MAVVQAKIDIDASPTRVWECIATSAGMSAWFVSTTIQPGESGSVTLRFGPGAEATMPIQMWDPPLRLRFGAPEGSDGRSHELVIESGTDRCLLTLRDDGVPDAEADATREGWTGMLGRLKSQAEGAGS